MVSWFLSCCCQDDGDGKATYVTLNHCQDKHLSVEGYGPDFFCHPDDGDPSTSEHQVIGVPTLNPRPRHAASEIFHVLLHRSRSQTKLGLQLDPCDGKVLYVTAILPGSSLVSEYNAIAPEDERILPGDYIRAVNGVDSSSWAAAQALNVGPKMHLHVQHPLKFTIRVQRNGEAMGVELNFSETGNSLVVVGITGGAMHMYQHQLRPRDRIETVNGFSGKAEELVEMIKEHQNLELAVSRFVG